MSIRAQALVLLSVATLALAGSAYRFVDWYDWSSSAIETQGILVRVEGIEGNPTRRGAPIQTLHYRYNGADGAAYQGSQKVWWGDRKLRTGQKLAVLFDRDRPHTSITRQGLDSGWIWAWSLIGLAVICGPIGAFCWSWSRPPGR